MTRSGTAYRLEPWAPLTAVTESGSWPTPRSSDTNGPGLHGDGGMDLRTAVLLLVPTPNSRDWKDSGPTQGERHTPNLGTAVHLLPTPNARDHKGMPGAGSRANGGRQASLPVSVGSGRLNPTWVEWLMGFPLGWTDCAASATPSSRRSPSSSATASSATSGPLTLF
jgi:hypothetical protein